MAESGVKETFAPLRDVSLKLSVGVGKCVKPFAEVMRLQPGDVLVLDKTKDDLIDIFVNDQFFMAGELVVANEKYSVRIVEIV